MKRSEHEDGEMFTIPLGNVIEEDKCRDAMQADRFLTVAFHLGFHLTLA